MGRLTNFQTRELSLTLSLDTSAYADGDVLAATQELALLSDTTAGPGGVLRGRITQVLLLDKDDQGASCDIVFLKTNVALGTENAAVSISDTNAEQILGIVSVTSYTDLINSQLARPSFDPIEFTLSDSTSLYVGAISRGTPTHTASGLLLRVHVQFDNIDT